MTTVAGSVDAVFVPGLMNDADLWSDVLEHMPGYVSSRVVDIRPCGSVDAMVKAILRGSPEHFALIGFSLGGIAALRLARDHGHRLSHLVLCGTTAYPDGPERTAERRDATKAAEGATAFHGFGRALSRRYISAKNIGREDLRSRIRAMTMRAGPEVLRRQMMMSRPDHGAALRTIDVPTLVLCGQDDRITPVDVHLRMAVDIPDSNLRVIPDAGHLLPMEEPERVSQELISFLKLER